MIICDRRRVFYFVRVVKRIEKLGQNVYIYVYITHLIPRRSTIKTRTKILFERLREREQCRSGTRQNGYKRRDAPKFFGPQQNRRRSDGTRSDDKSQLLSRTIDVKIERQNGLLNINVQNLGRRYGNRSKTTRRIRIIKRITKSNAAFEFNTRSDCK